MAQRNTSGFSDQFDLEQMLVEAQHRWLRTPEICEILRNHKRFNVAPEPPNMPPSGSLFLFDRKVLRYFRKDGHRWRKKKDAKTVKEAHERLKAGSIDVLHCYYAHGEENENFQRRSYWLLEEELSHIVLVHYREVKGYRTNFNRFKETEQAISNATKIQQIACNSEAESSINSGIKQINRQLLCQNAESRSLNSGLSLDYEHVETDSYQTKSPAVSSLEIDEDNSLQKHKKELDLWEWEDSLQSHSVSAQAASVNHSMYKVSGEDAMPLGFPCKLKDTIMPKLHDYLVTDNICLDGHTMDAMDHLRNRPSVSACLEDQSDVESNLTIREKSGNSSAARTLLDRPVKDEVLTESDSFSQWICKELGYMEPGMPSSVAYRAADDKISDYTIHSPKAYSDSYTLGPSLSQERLFRIIDFAPNWGYADSETKVLITGKFLEAQQDAGKHQFSCMFGEMEVPAEVIADGVLRCYAPPHDVARVHFFVTCANRVACSEVREFEYRDKFIHRFDVASLGNNPDALQIRFCKLLSLGSRRHRSSMHCNLDGSSDSHHEITSLLKGIGSEWFQILELTSKEFSLVEVKDRLGEKFLKAKLCEWLLCKEAEGDDSLRVLNENGQGVLHLAAALGYDWAISPIVAAGVSINFRDVCGWTALHFAAYYGRERTIAYLISMGAFAGALTDPTPTYPMGRTSADLASDNGHKGIAGFLAESALSAHLECLALVDSNKQDNVIEPCGITSVLTVSERVPTPVSVSEDTLDGLSLKDSLAALCNATQAAAQIHQIFRLHSFKRKQIKECGNNKIETSDEYDVSILALKTQKQGQREGHVHAAAIKIQDKFRSWKGRRDFVRLRQKIVKIQAHFRGHQVRKHYKAFVWSVGILEKVILRWRRKRSGLRGFKSVSSTVKSQSDSMSSKEDDYDFLKQGRKQSEERLQKALSRVKSMVRHPEARDQYRRLLTTMGEIKELKDGYSSAMDRPDASASMDDDMVDIDALLNGGTMPYEIAKRHLYVTD